MKYKSEQYLSELRETLYDYLPNHLPDNIKPKLQANVIRVYSTSKYTQKNKSAIGMYDIQLGAVTQINEISNSQLLGCNEVVIPVIVEEYRKLKEILGILINEYKALNQFQELKVEDILEKDPGYFGWMMNGDFPLYTKEVLKKIKLRSFNKGNVKGV